MEHVLSAEVNAYEAMKPELVSKYEGRFVLFKQHDLLGVYDSFASAFEAGVQKLGNVPMLIKQVERVETVVEVPTVI